MIVDSGFRRNDGWDEWPRQVTGWKPVPPHHHAAFRVAPASCRWFFRVGNRWFSAVAFITLDSAIRRNDGWDEWPRQVTGWKPVPPHHHAAFRVAPASCRWFFRVGNRWFSAVAFITLDSAIRRNDGGDRREGNGASRPRSYPIFSSGCTFPYIGLGHSTGASHSTAFPMTCKTWGLW